MNRLASILLLAILLPAAASAQEPGVDEEECQGQDSALLSRMPGCGLFECAKKDFDAFDVVINKAGEMQTLEGAGQQREARRLRHHVRDRPGRHHAGVRRRAERRARRADCEC